MTLTTPPFTHKTHHNAYTAITTPTTPNSTILITGASRGIGLATALAFARANARGIILVARSAAGVEAARSAVLAANPAVEVLGLTADIADEGAVEQVMLAARERFGGVDVLVNNAGVLHRDSGPVAHSAVSTWWPTYETNVKGTFIVTATFLRFFATEKTTIINIVADPQVAIPGVSSYFSGKAALIKLSEFVAVENPAVVCVAVHPGIVPSEDGGLLEEAKGLVKDDGESSFERMMLDSRASFCWLINGLLETRLTLCAIAELPAGVCVWLAARRPAFLSGRYVAAHWDVEELEARRDEIVEGDKLKLRVSVDA